MLRLAILLGALLLSVQADAATLYVNNTGSPACSDATTKAGNASGTPWCTIGRAAWGNATRASANTSEAAAAGDIVLVTGGTYNYAGSINDRFDPLYEFVNEGSAGNLIEIRCIGDCTLTAPSLDAPIIGSFGSTADYQKWYADISLGYSWVISSCPLLTTCPGSGVVTIHEDTGPILFGGGVTGGWVEGVVVTSTDDADYNDNYDAIRIENCTSCTIRNNSMTGFRITPSGNANGTCIKLYGSTNGLIEHNYCNNAATFLYFKDTASTQLQSGNVVRLNYATTLEHGFRWSEVTGGSTEDRNYVYQNIINAASLPTYWIGAVNDWVYNNLFVNGTSGMGVSTGPTGIRQWNNIVSTHSTGIQVEAAAMVADTSTDLEHNVYHAVTNVYNDYSGNRTLANFKAAYTDQEQATPAGVEVNPSFANAAGGDYRLCTAAGVPHASCAGASSVLTQGVDLGDLDGDTGTTDAIPAGPYVSGSEVIGLDASALTVPDPPTIGSATAGNTQCVVTFTPPGDDGGATITGYTATSSPSSITGSGSSSPITVTGLSNGTGYTFTVTATNSQGTSSPSSASNSCTPVAATGAVRLRRK